jgi:hypothetical protein
LLVALKVIGQDPEVCAPRALSEPTHDSPELAFTVIPPVGNTTPVPVRPPVALTLNPTATDPVTETTGLGKFEVMTVEVEALLTVIVVVAVAVV